MKKLKGNITEVLSINTILTLLVFAIIILVITMIPFQSMLYNYLTTKEIEKIEALYNSIDIITIIIFSFMFILSLLLALKISSSPAYFVFSILLIGITFLIIQTINTIPKTIFAHPNFQYYTTIMTQKYPVTYYIINNITIISLGWFITIMFATYIGSKI